MADPAYHHHPAAPPAAPAPGDHVHRGHDYLGTAHDANARRTRWVVALTAVTMVAEIVAGYLTGSMALLADGFHMATHAGALGVAALAYAYARRHVHDPRFSFGTGKVGDLAGFASALVLGIVALGIGVESFERLLAPRAVAFGDAIIVAVLGLLVNLASALLLSGGHHHGHAHDHHGPDHHGHGHGHGRDNNLRAAYVHVLADALTSVLAIAALVAGRYFGWLWLDAAVGIVGAVVIARWAWSLMQDTAWMLLDASEPQLAERIRALVEMGGDAHVTDLHVWRVGPDAHAAIVDVTGNAGERAIRARLHGVPGIAHLTVAVREAA